MNNFCTYCSAQFGTMVYYHGKIKILARQYEHFTPISKNGLDSWENITDACQICNMIKMTKDFDSGTDAQNYILDKLLESDWRIIRLPAEGLGLPPRRDADPEETSRALSNQENEPIEAPRVQKGQSSRHQKSLRRPRLKTKSNRLDRPAPKCLLCQKKYTNNDLCTNCKKLIQKIRHSI